MSVGRAMNGGGSKARRVKVDFYATPALSTSPVLPILKRFGFPKTLWEPCCGEGHMSITLERAGYKVISTDKVARGYGKQADLLDYALGMQSPPASAVVTNLPFDHADRMLAIMLDDMAGEITHVASILPLNFFCAKKRLKLFNEHPPAAVCPMTWRMDVKGLGRPTMSMQWVVWAQGNNAGRKRFLSSARRVPAIQCLSKTS
jgi:hypothetical protein